MSIVNIPGHLQTRRQYSWFIPVSLPRPETDAALDTGTALSSQYSSAETLRGLSPYCLTRSGRLSLTASKCSP